MYKKLVLIFFIIVILRIFFVKKNSQPLSKKSWLFLINGKNATITKEQIILDLTHNIVAFTDRPYHDIKQLDDSSTEGVAKWISTTKSKPNATILAIPNNNNTFSSSAVIELKSMKLSGSNIKQLIIDYKILSGSIGNTFPMKYKYISITIDDWFSDLGNNIIHAATSIGKNIKDDARKVCSKTFDRIMDFGIKKSLCGGLCGAIAVAVDAVGGGPEDLVADGIDIGVTGECATNCAESMYYIQKTYETVNTIVDGKTAGEYFCNLLIK